MSDGDRQIMASKLFRPMGWEYGHMIASRRKPRQNNVDGRLRGHRSFRKETLGIEKGEDRACPIR